MSIAWEIIQVPRERQCWGNDWHSRAFKCARHQKFVLLREPSLYPDREIPDLGDFLYTCTIVCPFSGRKITPEPLFAHVFGGFLYRYRRSGIARDFPMTFTAVQVHF
jgi:hypothetical protein